MARAIEKVDENCIRIRVFRDLKDRRLLRLLVSVQVVYPNWNADVVYQCHDLDLALHHHYLVCLSIDWVHFLLAKLIDVLCLDVAVKQERVGFYVTRSEHPHVHD